MQAGGGCRGLQGREEHRRKIPGGAEYLDEFGNTRRQRSFPGKEKWHIKFWELMGNETQCLAPYLQPVPVNVSSQADLLHGASIPFYHTKNWGKTERQQGGKSSARRYTEQWDKISGVWPSSAQQTWANTLLLSPKILLSVKWGVWRTS